MARRLFTLLSAVSLLLCVAVCVLWVRSAFAADVFCVRLGRDAKGGQEVRAYLASHRHGIGAGVRWGDQFTRGAWEWRRERPKDYLGAGWPDASPVNRIGFAAFGYRGASERIVVLVAPSWFLLLLAAALPAGRLVSAQRRRLLAARAGLCQRCGYDLRATPGRCPECGTIPAAVKV